MNSPVTGVAAAAAAASARACKRVCLRLQNGYFTGIFNKCGIAVVPPHTLCGPLLVFLRQKTLSYRSGDYNGLRANPPACEPSMNCAVYSILCVFFNWICVGLMKTSRIYLNLTSVSARDKNK